jgi:hypothetical protein
MPRSISQLLPGATLAISTLAAALVTPSAEAFFAIHHCLEIGAAVVLDHCFELSAGFLSYLLANATGGLCKLDSSAKGSLSHPSFFKTQLLWTNASSWLEPKCPQDILLSKQHLLYGIQQSSLTNDSLDPGPPNHYKSIHLARQVLQIHAGAKAVYFSHSFRNSSSATSKSKHCYIYQLTAD